jgi:hypothetical protein
MNLLLTHISEKLQELLYTVSEHSGATKTITSSLQHLPEADKPFFVNWPKKQFCVEVRILARALLLPEHLNYHTTHFFIP